MLAAINDEEDSFTGGRYNILRVVAAYPLDAGISSSQSEKIKEAVNADKHPLAILKVETRSIACISCQIRPYAPGSVILDQSEFEETLSQQ
jgi:hypothetical protein